MFDFASTIAPAALTRLTRKASFVERVCFPEGIGIELDDRVQGRPLLVVRVDPPEVLFDECTAGQPAGRELRLDPSDRRFVDLKSPRALGVQDQKRKEQSNSEARGQRSHGRYLTSPVLHFPNH